MDEGGNELRKERLYIYIYIVCGGVRCRVGNEGDGNPCQIRPLEFLNFEFLWAVSGSSRGRYFDCNL